MSGRILIVEDNAAMANLWKFNLERSGFEVVTAPTGNRALEIATDSHFDAIISDQQMPGMSGTEFCRALRDMPEYQTTPLLLCTAKGFELDRQSLLEKYDIAHVVPKPVSPRWLVGTMHELVSPVTTG